MRHIEAGDKSVPCAYDIPPMLAICAALVRSWHGRQGVGKHADTEALDSEAAESWERNLKQSRIRMWSGCARCSEGQDIAIG